MNIAKVYIKEIYDSVQGEGHLTGHLTRFVRFAGCSIGCAWCDTKSSWKKDKGEKWNAFDLTKHITTKLRKGMWVCLTGGEPLEQFRSLKWICEKLERMDVQNVCLETCGCPINDVIDIIDLYNTGIFFSISPKLPSALKKRYNQNMFENIVNSWYKNISATYRLQFKFVVSTEKDLSCLYTLMEKNNKYDCHLFIQLERSKMKDKILIKKIIDFITMYPAFRFTIQQHTVLNIK